MRYQSLSWFQTASGMGPFACSIDSENLSEAMATGFPATASGTVKIPQFAKRMASPRQPIPDTPASNNDTCLMYGNLIFGLASTGPQLGGLQPNRDCWGGRIIMKDSRLLNDAARQESRSRKSA